jgi:hypothetical protein
VILASVDAAVAALVSSSVTAVGVLLAFVSAWRDRIWRSDQAKLDRAGQAEQLRLSQQQVALTHKAPVYSALCRWLLELSREINAFDANVPAAREQLDRIEALWKRGWDQDEHASRVAVLGNSRVDDLLWKTIQMNGTFWLVDVNNSLIGGSYATNFDEINRSRTEFQDAVVEIIKEIRLELGMSPSGT